MNQLIVTCFIALSSFAFSSITFSAVESSKSPDYLLAKVTQTKKLNGISFLIKSQGEAVFIKNIGVYNEIKKPFFQAVSYSKAGIKEFDKTGKLIVNQATNNRVDEYVSKILVALFNDDQKALSSIFSTRTQQIGKEQKITLKPKSRTVEKFIQQIELLKDRYLRELRIQSSNGDETTLVFSDFTPLSKAAVKPYCNKFPGIDQPPCTR